MNKKYLLKLYIMGSTLQSNKAVNNIKKICKEELNGEYHLEIINILENPQLAEDDRIIVVPTLVKALPEPLRRVIGDLSNTEKVLLGLDLVSVNKTTDKGE